MKNKPTFEVEIPKNTLTFNPLVDNYFTIIGDFKTNTMRLTKFEEEQIKEELNCTFYNCLIKFAIVIAVIILIVILIICNVKRAI